MKKMMRILALLLALVMALPAGAMAAEEDGPRLVINWLDWDEEGRCYVSEDVLSPENYGEDTLGYNPGRGDHVIFFVLDGDKKTPVVPTGNGISVYPVGEEGAASGAKHSDCYVVLELDGWHDAELTCDYQGKKLSLPVHAELPVEGFYTAPEATQENFLTSHEAADLEDGTVYFISLRNDEEHDSHLMNVRKNGDDGRYTVEEAGENIWKVVLNLEEGNLWVDLETQVQGANGDRWKEGQSWEFWQAAGPRLCVRGAEWDEGKAFVPAEYGYDNSFQLHMNEFPLVVFCTIDGWDEEGNPVNVQYIPVKELTFSEGVEVYDIAKDFPENIETGDKLAECYVQLNVLENDQEYTVTYGEYTMHFDSYLPELSVYSAPEASFDTWTNVGRFGPCHAEDVSYLIGAGTLERNGRVVKSLKLMDAHENNISNLVSLEQYAEGVYAIRMKSGSKLPDGFGRFALEITWENENGETWTEEGWEFTYENYTTLLVGEEPLADGTGDDLHEAAVKFSTVADKASSSLTLAAGEEKTIYLAQTYSPDEESPADWEVFAPLPVMVNSSDEALKLTMDARDASKYTVSCNQPGEYEIYLTGYMVRFLDGSGKQIPEEEFVELFDEFWLGNGLAHWVYDWKTGKAVFYNGDEEAVECPYETVIISGERPNWFTVKVTVEDEATPVTQVYSDLTNPKAWYIPAVQFVTDKKMMNGSNGAFNPNASMKGSEFVQIMWNIAKQPAAAAGASFTGAEGRWYAPAVLWAAGEGLVSDTGDGALVPDENISRQQLAVILYNMEKRPAVGEVDLSAFSDAGEISAWALDAVKWAVSEHILNGADGKLNPTGESPRSNVAQLLMNYYG